MREGLTEAVVRMRSKKRCSQRSQKTNRKTPASEPPHQQSHDLTFGDTHVDLWVQRLDQLTTKPYVLYPPKHCCEYLGAQGLISGFLFCDTVHYSQCSFLIGRYENITESFIFW